MWTVISGIFGGVLRLVPEFIKMWNKKEDNKQEILVMEKTFQLDKQRSELHITEIREEGKIALDTAAISSLTEAIRGQNEQLTYTGKPIVDFFISIANILNKLIRPIITIQWVVVLYPAVIVTTFVILIQSNVPVVDAMNKVFGETEKGICLFILDFWFIGRVLDAVRKR
ncbi:MAG: hypothetical protein PHQ86_09815 [Dehalococcoidales bacterium]|nr:hypothetical protein [Dehalococcoidales bacterium]